MDAMGIDRYIIIPACELTNDISGRDVFYSASARRLLLAIGYQESGFKDRIQTIGGHARGFWQFERGGGSKGVLDHAATGTIATDLCNWFNVNPDPASLWLAVGTNDLLAAACARLLLWSDPKPLPAIKADAWDYYNRVWRPGKPHPDRWNISWNFATQAV